jgi:phosphomethylpyrimidine synthase
MRNHIGRYKMSNGRIEKIRQLLFTILRDRSLIPISKSTFAKDCRIREQWILDRNDVEELSEISSDYGKQRLHDEN